MIPDSDPSERQQLLNIHEIAMVFVHVVQNAMRPAVKKSGAVARIRKIVTAVGRELLGFIWAEAE